MDELKKILKSMHDRKIKIYVDDLERRCLYALYPEKPDGMLDFGVEQNDLTTKEAEIIRAYMYKAIATKERGGPGGGTPPASD